MKPRNTTPAMLLALALSFVLAKEARAGECSDNLPIPDECYPDVLCPQYSAYWDLRRAVVHISGPDFLGTGVLINNAKCHSGDTNCGTPYLLTANHVASGALGWEMSEGEMADLQDLTDFTFGLEAATCGGPAAGGAVALEGASIIAHSPKKDLLLLQLSTSLPPELGAYFVGWCDNPVNQAVSISHPCGAPKRIAITDFGEIYLNQTMNRQVYDVYWWEQGALAAASSGAPLLDSNVGRLRGIFTNSVQAGSEACSDPNNPTPAQDRFTAVSTILEFLPHSVSSGLPCIDPFDANEGAPIIGTVENSDHYGPGTNKKITATEEVWLVDGFSADMGSTITISIQP